MPRPIILWSVDPLDWKYRNADTVYNNIIKGAHDGAIVLTHDIYQTSVQGALRAIDTLKAQGYEFVTVAELLRRRSITPQNGVVYTSAPNKGTNLPAYTAPTITSTPGDNGVFGHILDCGQGADPVLHDQQRNPRTSAAPNTPARLRLPRIQRSRSSASTNTARARP